MKTKVKITWCHGDADLETKKVYTVENLDKFLSFIFEFRGAVHNDYRLGFSDNSLSHQDVKKLVEKHGKEFEDLIPHDESCMGGCNGMHPTIDAIHVVIGREKKNIVWRGLASAGEPTEIPSKGSVISVSSGNISFMACLFKDIPSNKFLRFEDLDKMGFGYAERDASSCSYQSLECEVVDCKVSNYQVTDCIHDYTELSATILLKFGEHYLTHSVSGNLTNIGDFNTENLYFVEDKPVDRRSK